MSLFKYLPPERVDVLESGRLRVSPPTERNDPFDEWPYIEVITERGARVEGGKRGLVGEALNRFVTHFVLDADRLNTEATIKLRNTNADDWGAICFSRVGDSIPMWSYYANEHRGFVIEFDDASSAFRDRFPLRTPIKYGRRGVVRGKTKRAAAVFRKAKEWRHEKEERVVFKFEHCHALLQSRGSPIYLAEYPRESVVAIHLGCRIDACLKGYIAAELGSWNFRHVRLIEVTADTKSFSLIPRVIRNPS